VPQTLKSIKAATIKSGKKRKVNRALSQRPLNGKALGLLATINREPLGQSGKRPRRVKMARDRGKKMK